MIKSERQRANFRNCASDSKRPTMLTTFKKHIETAVPTLMPNPMSFISNPNHKSQSRPSHRTEGPRPKSRHLRQKQPFPLAINRPRSPSPLAGFRSRRAGATGVTDSNLDRPVPARSTLITPHRLIRSILRRNNEVEWIGQILVPILLLPSHTLILVFLIYM